MCTNVLQHIQVYTTADGTTSEEGDTSQVVLNLQLLRAKVKY